MSIGLKLFGIGLKHSVFVCGNPSCQSVIAFVFGGKRPVRCERCGADIDWVGTRTKIVKECPTCKTIYPEQANYCTDCKDDFVLRPKEVELFK
jgi:phage FluMu protein Com